MGWVGKVHELIPGQKLKTKKGYSITTNGAEKLVQNARPLHAGLVKGSGDGVGWRTVEITEEMVGKKVAIFLSMETKTDKGTLSDEQINWHNHVIKAGGLSIIVRKPEDASQIDMWNDYP
jgi:hypothetical protein